MKREMKRKVRCGPAVYTLMILLFLLFTSRCKKERNPVKYPLGSFPDTVVNLTGLNSPYDDYNSTGYELSAAISLIFSSNRQSQGGQFDLEQGLITFNFNQTTGSFQLTAGMTQDIFTDNLIAKAVTPGDDLGPYRIYSPLDGNEYLILASENEAGNLDLRYCMNVPANGSMIPPVSGPYPVTLLNTEYDDAYLGFNLKGDSAYFTSNIEGNFDIYVKTRSKDMSIAEWFGSDYSPSGKVEIVNSPEDDKCPIVYNKLMVFTSDRPGGFGGFDLYYSIFRDGDWTQPVNLGPKINTSSDEYRPLIGFHSEFTNLYLIFSSNRPGGNGGYDLYFTGLDVPD